MSVRPFWFSFDLGVACSRRFLPNRLKANASLRPSAAEYATAAVDGNASIELLLSFRYRVGDRQNPHLFDNHVWPLFRNKMTAGWNHFALNIARNH